MKPQNTQKHEDKSGTLNEESVLVEYVEEQGIVRITMDKTAYSVCLSRNILLENAQNAQDIKLPLQLTGGFGKTVTNSLPILLKSIAPIQNGKYTLITNIIDNNEQLAVLRTEDEEVLIDLDKQTSEIDENISFATLKNNTKLVLQSLALNPGRFVNVIIDKDSSFTLLRGQEQWKADKEVLEPLNFEHTTSFDRALEQILDAARTMEMDNMLPVSIGSFGKFTIVPNEEAHLYFQKNVNISLDSKENLTTEPQKEPQEITNKPLESTPPAVEDIAPETIEQTSFEENVIPLSPNQKVANEIPDKQELVTQTAEPPPVMEKNNKNSTITVQSEPSYIYQRFNFSNLSTGIKPTRDQILKGTLGFLISNKNGVIILMPEQLVSKARKFTTLQKMSPTELRQKSESDKGSFAHANNFLACIVPQIGEKSTDNIYGAASFDIVLKMEEAGMIPPIPSSIKTEAQASLQKAATLNSTTPPNGVEETATPDETLESQEDITENIPETVEMPFPKKLLGTSSELEYAKELPIELCRFVKTADKPIHAVVQNNRIKMFIVSRDMAKRLEMLPNVETERKTLNESRLLLRNKLFKLKPNKAFIVTSVHQKADVINGRNTLFALISADPTPEMVTALSAREAPKTTAESTPNKKPEAPSTGIDFQIIQRKDSTELSVKERFNALQEYRAAIAKTAAEIQSIRDAFKTAVDAVQINIQNKKLYLIYNQEIADIAEEVAEEFELGFKEVHLKEDRFRTKHTTQGWSDIFNTMLQNNQTITVIHDPHLNDGVVVLPDNDPFLQETADLWGLDISE